MLGPIRGSQNLNQLKETTEFLKAIATSDGLSTALAQLADEYKKVEDAKAELQQHINNNSALLVQLRQQEQNSRDRHDAAEARVKEADDKLRKANAAWQAIEDATARLEAKERTFVDQKAEAEAHLRTATDVAEKKRAEASAMYAEGLAMKEKYESLTASLRQTVMA